MDGSALLLFGFLNIENRGERLRKGRGKKRGRVWTYSGTAEILSVVL